ncbi:MAG: amidophosphoribosyltransferase [Sulfobacillus thermosulfidooxidans]|uniref:Amidophosphoribosyltransferase n=1 Tax=Sulfobacillus thermotolerans TaxID=338644 RepID=A0ABM6RRQ6_9FIRM|nr:amidophosphoribosyltransferase [Sulfobacillus sp. hq2]AUW94016.1 amidophosphoribosyltransferase [Sulfobacillus thermotolerans]MCY0909156.1 amidophosphoribosyltransferase [Sulfobacillus thermotolerans]POB11880.1 amidophosphoribosyltransferase [Sulfobacillus sp. hq2]PSR37520.1 MAG: amidophosphoribosyltransferase [Sulfobacillus thermosulfidooxidans]
MAQELHDECGVFGIYGDPQAALKSYWGTFSLQHRGQESAGLAVLHEDAITVNKGMGLVTEALKVEQESQRIGHAAIGHVRYSTTGESSLVNAQPLLMKTRFGLLALGQNGNLVNGESLRERLESQGAIFQGTTDSEVLAHLIARSAEPSFYDALKESLRLLEGGFAFTVLTPQALYGARDVHGIRPLALGQTKEGAYILASESCAFDVVGARYVRDIEPGELVRINDDGIETDRFVEKKSERALCAFEMIYFARPDSRMEGQSTHVVRRRLGQILAQEAPARADVVVGVPDSSIPAAMGYAQASGLPFDFGLVKNRYVARTFIAPSQALRESAVQMKLSAVRDVVFGKRVILVDDSLVRGTTSRHLVQLLRQAGATEVHMRIASPPYTDPCHYGIDTSRATELAARNMNIEEIRTMVGADSLAYLSLQGLKTGLGQQGWCMACFGAGYPVPLEEQPVLPLMQRPIGVKGD